MRRYPITSLLCLAGVLGALPILRGQMMLPPTPPQDQGLPYTRSAQPFAVAKIKDYIAVFAGSRYAWVHGYKVRLDDVNWRGEAVLRDGKIYVPTAFAGVLDLAEVKPAPAPAYLADGCIHCNCPRQSYRRFKLTADLTLRCRTKRGSVG
jgi:hypothetical protein